MVSGPGNMDSIKKAAGEGVIQGGVKGAMKKNNPGGIWVEAKAAGHVSSGSQQVAYEGTLKYPVDDIPNGHTSGTPNIDYGKVGKETLEGAAEGMQSDKKWSGTVHIEGETEYTTTYIENGNPVGEVTGKAPYTTDVKVEGETEYTTTYIENGNPVGEVTGKAPYTTDVKVEGELQK